MTDEKVVNPPRNEKAVWALWDEFIRAEEEDEPQAHGDHDGFDSGDSEDGCPDCHDEASAYYQDLAFESYRENLQGEKRGLIN
jgi:hypothetical protein